MSGPVVHVDIEQIETNAKVIRELCDEQGISLTGVTKGTCGMPQVAQAFIRAGIKELGESRLENIHRLRASGITLPMMLLRIPPLSAAEEIVRSVNISLNSELPIIKKLSEVALSLGIVHDIILMVDLGDLREGIWPGDLLPTVSKVLECEGVRIRGIGTNLTCYGGVIPTEKNLQQLVDHAQAIEDRFNISMDIISGGNSSSLNLLAAGKIPSRINNLRIGEAILLGRETVERRAWPNTGQKTFILSAELIEQKTKPSMPIGETGQDAFGGKPFFHDKGDMLRGILSIGREDVDISGLEACDSKITILGASSDHLIIDMSHCDKSYDLGDTIDFVPNYSALLAAMTSSYVSKEVKFPKDQQKPKASQLQLIGSLFDYEPYAEKLNGQLRQLGYEIERIHNPLLQSRVTVVDSSKQQNIKPILVFGGSDQAPIALKFAEKTMKQYGLLWVDFKINYHELSLVLDQIKSGHSLVYENLVILGIREVDEESAKLIRQHNIKVFTMEDISLLPMREIMRQSLTRTTMGTEGLYLKFSSRAASNINDGLTVREIHTIMEMIATSRTIRIIEWNDQSDKLSTDQLQDISKFLLSCLGKRILRDFNVTT